MPSSENQNSQLAPSSKPDVLKTPHIIVPTLTFIIGLVLSIATFMMVTDWDDTELQRVFESNAHNRLSGMKAAIIRHQDVVNSIAGLFSSSSEVSRKEFRFFVQDALSRQPSIHALEWIPLVKKDQRDHYTLQAHEAGFNNFDIIQIDKNNQAITVDEKDEYMPVYYIEPYRGNEQAMGFDLSTNPTRLAAIHKARDTGFAVITERIKLVQENQDRYGYLLFKAIYQKGKPNETLAQKRENFTGLSTGVFSFEELLSTSMHNISTINMDILMLDMSAKADNQFLHYHSFRTDKEAVASSPINSAEHIDGLHWQTSIDVLGREWSLLFIPAPSFLESRESLQAWLILLAGIIISTLLSLYIFSNNIHVVRIDRTNARIEQETAEYKAQRHFTDTVLHSASDVIVVLDLNGRIVRFNRTAEEITGYSSSELLGQLIWDWLIPVDQKTAVMHVFNNLRKGNIEITRQYENDWLTRDGRHRLFQWHNSLLYDESGKVTHIVAMGYDITEKRKVESEHEQLQRELQQAQKMESLGQLTGGIAHDFNNLLGIINGYASLLNEKCKKINDDKGISYTKQISDAGNRAAKLVSQMLTFSRSEHLDDLPLQFEPLLKDNIDMLRASLPSSIDITTEIEPNVPSVLMNPTNFHQLLMNLSVNARDAMQGNGQITIKLSLVKNLDVLSQTSHKPIKGDWVDLSVNDSGSGIDSKTMEHIFEPFFTTKSVGKGTGMGLAVIYGIMQSHNGHIIVESEPGNGTTFRLLFPPIQTNSETHIKTKPNQDYLTPNHGEKILVVDDEESLASFMVELLLSYGYEASYIIDSSEALATFRRDPDNFSLLITDFTMPKMTGERLIELIREFRPELPAILCTGHSDKFDTNMSNKLNIPYFEKPVNIKNLLLKISELLK